jgi:hypothetical protein
MIARWISLVLVTLWLTSCGEATVRPFAERSDAGIDASDDDAGDDDGGDDDGGDDDRIDDDEVDGGEEEPDDPAMRDPGGA